MGVEVQQLSRRFGARWVLIRASAEFPPGSSTWLQGANGAGKTTFLRCLATALRPHDGSIRTDGEDLWANRWRFRPLISFLAHHTRMYDDLNAKDNLTFWARLRNTSPGADASKVPGVDASAGISVDTLLARVGLDPTRRDPVRTFSAGMKRRLALARVLLQSPTLVLFDEPHAALDPEGRALVDSVIGELASTGATIIVASHRPVEACARTLKLVDGRMVQA